MTNTFKNASVTAGTSPTVLYTCPGATVAIIHALYLANTVGSTISVSVTFYDATLLASKTLLNAGVITPNNFIVFDKPINLKAGDQISLQASQATSCDVFASVLEIS